MSDKKQTEFISNEPNATAADPPNWPAIEAAVQAVLVRYRELIPPDSDDVANEALRKRNKLMNALNDRNPAVSDLLQDFDRWIQAEALRRPIAWERIRERVRRAEARLTLPDSQFGGGETGVGAAHYFPRGDSDDGDEGGRADEC